MVQYKCSLLLKLLAWYLCLLAPNVLAVDPRPKGVSVEQASYYNPATDFKCLDGSNVVAFIQVNDDYCDCQVSN